IADLVIPAQNLTRERVDLVPKEAEWITREKKKRVSEPRAARRREDVQLRMRRGQHTELRCKQIQSGVQDFSHTAHPRTPVRFELGLRGRDCRRPVQTRSDAK